MVEPGAQGHAVGTDEVRVMADAGGHRAGTCIGQLERDLEAILTQREGLTRPVVQRRAGHGMAEGQLGPAGARLLDHPWALPALTMDRVRLGRQVPLELVDPALEREARVGDAVGERHQRKAARGQRIAVAQARRTCRPQHIAPAPAERP